MAKYCANCRKFFENDGINFCDACGSSQFVPIALEKPAAPVAEEPKPVVSEPIIEPAPVVSEQVFPEPAIEPAPAVAEQTVEPAPAVTAPVIAEPVMTNQFAAPGQPAAANTNYGMNMPGFNSIPAPKKKKSGAKKFIFAGIAVVLVLAIILNMSSIVSLFTKLFGSDKSYFALVEKNSIEDYADTLATYYEDYYLDTALEDRDYKVKFDLNISDEVRSTLESEYTSGVSMDWLNKTEFEVDLNTYAQKLASNLLIDIDGQRVLTTDYFIDAENSEMLLSLKEITDDVLKFKLDDSDNQVIGALISDNKESTAEMMPKASVIKKLITKYHGIFVDGIEKVTKSKETVEVSGVSQELTVFETEISETTLKKISLDILGELKKDSDIKAIFTKAKKVLEENDMAEFSDDPYESFIAEIDEYIEEINGEETDDEETVLKFYDYVNSDSEIVGRKFGEGDRGIDYVTVQNGKDVATKAVFGNRLNYTGTGTKKGDKLTGDYKFESKGEPLCKITFKDFDTKALKKGEFSGTATIAPSKIAGNSSAIAKYASMFDFAVKFDGKGDSDSGKLNIAVLNGEKELFSANTEYSISSAKSASAPGGKKIDVGNSDDLQQLLGDLHLDKLISNLKKTSFPKEYIEILQKAADSLAG